MNHVLGSHIKEPLLVVPRLGAWRATRATMGKEEHTQAVMRALLTRVGAVVRRSEWSSVERLALTEIFLLTSPPLILL